jgi:E3 ubiquitin-protein ligase XBAT32/33
MQACQYGHWEVVQTLILFNANVSIYILNPTATFFYSLLDL